MFSAAELETAPEIEQDRGRVDSGERTTTLDSLLGLLSLRPMSGYELRKLIEESIGNFWSESFGQIYPALRRMVAEGLVEVEESQGEGRPLRKVYRLTDAGRERLLRWIGQPPRLQVPRNELLLKVFFGFQRGPEVVIAHLQGFLGEQRRLRAHYESILRDLDGTKGKHPGAPYWRATVRFGLREREASIAWAEETIAEMRQIQ